MRVLIIGGTRFLGRYLTEAALANGDEVTLFNRGKSRPGLFPQVEALIGDRNGDLSTLKSAAQKGRRDVVIDTCGYTTRQVRAMADALEGQIEHYTFVSSISVYRDFSQLPLTENAPLHELSEETDEVTGENYGAQKAAAEKILESHMPDRVLNVRAGLIIGPHDYTGRFPYWVRRVAHGGEVLAPGNPQRVVQVIDVRDLANWILQMAAARRSGTFNATGPDYRLTMQAMLDACREGTNSQATFTWVDDEFLSTHDVSPWEEMPLWLPANLNMDGMLQTDISKALASGLRFRPLVQTVRDVWAWIQASPAEASGDTSGLVGPAGLAAEKETNVLNEWHNRS
jgi:2'-hydroxyisoflavone reductase